MALQSEKMINPLLKHKLEIEEDDIHIVLDQVNISKYFQKIYILVPLKNTLISEEFYEREILRDNWKSLENKLVLEETSNRILKIFDIFQNISLVTSSDLEMFNLFGLDLDEKIIVIPIFDIAYKNIKDYLKTYEGLYTLEDLYKIHFISDHFSTSSEETKNGISINFKKNTTNIIRNLEEVNFWTRKYNCLMNISKNFISRSFRLSLTRNLKDKEAIDAIKTLNKDNKVNDYLDHIFDSKNFIDAASCLDKNGYKLYYISKSNVFTKNDITSLFSKLDITQKYYLFSHLVVSKKHCHLVINNYDILKIMQPLISKFSELYRYLFGYAWIRFYTEESIKKSWITKDDEFIFDINTASLLPVFPFSLECPKKNPYFTLLVNDKLLQKNNIGGFSFYNNRSEFRNQGIVNLDGFKKRLNIFMTGNSSNDIFNGIDWEKAAIGVSGSVMTACLQKRHPLLELIKGKNSFDNVSEFDLDYMRFFNEYYPEADLDVMIKSNNPLDLIKKLKYIYNQIVVNICFFNPSNAEPNHVKMDIYKTVYLFVTEDFIESEIVSEYYSYENIIDNINSQEIIHLFMPYILKKNKEFYENLFDEYSKEEVENFKIIHPEIFSQNITEYQVHIKNGKNANKKNMEKTTEIPLDNVLDSEDSESFEVDKNRLKKSISGFNISFKAKIKSTHLMRPVELFSVFGNDFFSLVSKFHLPCVRSYYDGSNVYLTPSCISSHLTYTNLDYKYFAGSNDQMKIILKYRMRGFGTILNKNEIDKLIKYASLVTFWNRLHDINLENKESIKIMLGSLTYNHKIFQPRLYNADLYDETIPFVNISDGYNEIPDLNAISKINDLELFITNILKGYEFDLSLIELQTIDEDGYVNPLEIDKIVCVLDRYKTLLSKKADKNKKNGISPKDKYQKIDNNLWDLEEDLLNSSDE